MMPILAALEVDNNTIVIGLVVMALIQLAQFAVNLRELFVRKPSIEAEFATKAEVAAVEADVDKLRDDLGAMERRISTEASRRASTLHQRMDDMDKDISNVPSRVVAMLRDTKGLL